MKIKISTFSSYLHESSVFLKENEDFINDLARLLNTNIEYATLDDYNCDLKLILIASGGSENYFLESINKLKEPYYLLTTGKNNSLAASLEILTYLNNNNLEGEILHGNTTYIANRINQLFDKTNKEYPVKLGVIGKPSDWLISSIPDRVKLLKLFNIKLVDISLDELIALYKQKDGFINDLKCFDLKELNKDNNLYLAFCEIRSRYNLVGLTVRCFDLLDSIHTTGCFSLAELNAKGIIGTCEGDISALISMYLIKKWFGKSSFQANPSKIDVDNKVIELAHCTCPFDMISSFKYDTHFESGIGVAIKGEFFEKDVTIFRLSSDLKRFYVGEGKIVANLNDMRQCRSQIRIKMNDDISVLLREPCGNHHMVFYGHYKDEIIDKLTKMGMRN